jgi:putative nucleotidyltransferase with HDIG domain
MLGCIHPIEPLQGPAEAADEFGSGGTFEGTANMGDATNSGSIFSQKLDRVAFIAYLLGAVVPLLALAVVVERFVLPALSDRLAIFGLIGAVVSIATLSLGAFLTLRRTTRASLQRIDRDNRRLGALLDVSGSLTGAAHGSDAAEQATRAALHLVGARASFVLVRAELGAAPVRLAVAGSDAEKLELEIVEPLVESAKLVMSQGQPALRGSGDGHPAMISVPIPGEAVPEGALIAVGHPDQKSFDTSGQSVLASLGGLLGVALRNATLREDQRNFFTHVTDMLVSALDSTLGYHKGHGMRVAALANRIGRELDLDEHRLQRVHFAALLHDVGMLKLERHLQQDRKSCAKHTVLGARMLTRIRVWQDLAPIVQHHHEWWDGSGYPDAISGASIPLESRIIAVCDVFDTITSPSSYKDPMTLDDATQEIQRGAGTQFDPDVVTTFVALVKRGEISTSD